MIWLQCYYDFVYISQFSVVSIWRGDVCVWIVVDFGCFHDFLVFLLTFWVGNTASFQNKSFWKCKWRVKDVSKILVKLNFFSLHLGDQILNTLKNVDKDSSSGFSASSSIRKKLLELLLFEYSPRFAYVVVQDGDVSFISRNIFNLNFYEISMQFFREVNLTDLTGGKKVINGTEIVSSSSSSSSAWIIGGNFTNFLKFWNLSKFWWIFFVFVLVVLTVTFVAVGNLSFFFSYKLGMLRNFVKSHEISMKFTWNDG